MGLFYGQDVINSVSLLSMEALRLIVMKADDDKEKSSYPLRVVRRIDWKGIEKNQCFMQSLICLVINSIERSTFS